MDYILSFGERLATFIVSNALASMGLKTKYLSGGEAGIMTDESFGICRADVESYKRKIEEYTASAYR